MKGHIHPVKYQIDDTDIFIERRGDDWAVTRFGSCLNSSGKWEYEPMPSHRDHAFQTRCRFSFRDAQGRAVQMAKEEKG